MQKCKIGEMIDLQPWLIGILYIMNILTVAVLASPVLEINL